MQQLADFTFSSAGKKKTFEKLILIGIDELNKMHQNIKRGYEAHLFDIKER